MHIIEHNQSNGDDNLGNYIRKDMRGRTPKDGVTKNGPCNNLSALILSNKMKQLRIQSSIPTSLLKKCVDVFAPVIANLANISFTEGMFPTRYKKAQVTPLLKKDGMDPESVSSYRPISNLNTISKILEKLFMACHKPHISRSNNFHIFQSAYRRYHSTETALLKILDDVYFSIEAKQTTCLAALDLSAVFDTIDHETLIRRLRSSFGVEDESLSWISSYLTDRWQHVKFDSISSTPLRCVPQGSVLRPLQFIA